eukprot:CAMPEP_0197626516 /NCGR_PEP_ID=MMETSP1338-20131121/5446_1 /TAXON_ID=43686 ORGANISM="Pelagodinium beii, Strain RCC1491" /NCGR_SAMPLE_ID=MMETSP1338 /ASSEMBLY_ACC=CAM_ASM_000754 /LENGTH=315 /DNA_ID=CAMNT_0043197057 /DNA_START=123 /DNA_END=1070 /DNA_ORIENTATION=-
MSKAKRPLQASLAVLSAGAVTSKLGPVPSEELWTPAISAASQPPSLWSWSNHAASATAVAATVVAAAAAAAAAESSSLWPQEGSSVSSLSGAETNGSSRGCNASRSNIGREPLHSSNSHRSTKNSFSMEVVAPDEVCKDLSVGGFRFARSQVLDGSELNAFGCCHLKYWGFQVCAAALYLPESKTRPLSGQDVMDPAVPKQLELRYLRSFPAERLRFVTRWAMSQNGFLKGSVEEDLLEFNQLYKDVGVGDCYTLSYSPSSEGGGRVTLQLNGVELGGIEGPQFSEAIFSVWFGEKPFLLEMKKELLRGLCIDQD